MLNMNNKPSPIKPGEHQKWSTVCCENETHYYLAFYKFAVKQCKHIFTLINKIAHIFVGKYFMCEIILYLLVSAFFVKRTLSISWVKPAKLFIRLKDNKAFLKACLHSADGPFLFLPTCPVFNARSVGGPLTQGRENLKYPCSFPFLFLSCLCRARHLLVSLDRSLRLTKSPVEG